ncbi:MAG: hypothetical protein KDB80_17740 [Planctomycetes bacterium]|nr:hypothetical protein [Planctomycetota bacterium]
MTSPQPKRHARPKRRIFLESRYQKLVRGLPQTIFYCPECKGDRRRRQDCTHCEGFGKLYKDSVQELLGRRLLPAFKAKFGKFHGAGREDVDVRMLGRGRPFVYEIVSPRKFDVDLDAVLEEFHERDGDRVRLDAFRTVERKRVAALKEAEHSKDYRAEVAFDRDVDPAALDAVAGKTFELVQRTPTRVAHRRGDIDRHRTVEVLAIESTGPRCCTVDMRCQHGTYVKEWISGDDGRTTPSLAGLVECEARCEMLDVLDILDD